jgi:hypothetical protein
MVVDSPRLSVPALMSAWFAADPVRYETLRSRWKNKLEQKAGILAGLATQSRWRALLVLASKSRWTAEVADGCLVLTRLPADNATTPWPFLVCNQA